MCTRRGVGDDGAGVSMEGPPSEQATTCTTRWGG